MPKLIPESELDAIYAIVSDFPDGVSIEGINDVLDSTLPRRTLQRRLALLVEQNRLLVVGQGRGCRYLVFSRDAARRSLSGKRLNRDRALAVLARLKPELVKRFSVTRLALFGSTANDSARPDSDVDIMVAFDGPATSKRYFGVQFLLEDELGRAVDLVTEKALRPELRPFIEREAIDV